MGITGKSVVQTILTVLFLATSFAWGSSIQGYILLIASAITVPIRPLEEFYEKRKISLKTRIILGVVIYLLLFIVPAIARNFF